MKTSKHNNSKDKKPASIRKHARILGQLGGRPKQETSKHENNLQNYTKINTMLRMK